MVVEYLSSGMANQSWRSSAWQIETPNINHPSLKGPRYPVDIIARVRPEEKGRDWGRVAFLPATQLELEG
jgi:hypothetical protein